jgi:hypothetical protein
MKLTINVHDEFGAFCGNGEAAARFRHERIDAYAGIAESIVLDFGGVRNANSSFCNALVANLISQNTAEIVGRIRFLNCNPNLQVMLRAAVDLGLSRLERASARVA